MKNPVLAGIPATAPFHLACRDRYSAARTGQLRTTHGTIETPTFMPVATQGTIKGLTPAQVAELGAEIVLVNAYHLSLRPGAELIAAMGGLHRFMGWERAILSDSGGYQIFSLAPLRTVSDEGVTFRSHVDGARLFLTPETVVGVQDQMGVDILMPLDDCAPAGMERRGVEDAMRRTSDWAVRSLGAARAPEGLLFAIVQGGLFADLRRDHAAQLAGFGFPGYAVGGLSVGEERQVTQEIAAITAAALPDDRPRYLMGVGLPQELLRFLGMGYDLFDCVLPTRNGRNGTYFTWLGRRNIRLARYAHDGEPVDPSCSCYACRNFSRAYLRHLAIAGEMLGAQLASLHNLHFYLGLMREARARINASEFSAWAHDRARRIEEGERQ